MASLLKKISRMSLVIPLAFLYLLEEKEKGNLQRGYKGTKNRTSDTRRNRMSNLVRKK